MNSSPRGAEVKKDNVFQKLELFPQLQNATEHCFPTKPESVSIMVKKITSSLYEFETVFYQQATMNWLVLFSKDVAFYFHSGKISEVYGPWILK